MKGHVKVCRRNHQVNDQCSNIHNIRMFFVEFRILEANSIALDKAYHVFHHLC